MTRWYRGRSRSLNGSMVIRSESKACVPSTGDSTGPSRRRISSNAVGQSSSVPSSNPIRCLVEVNEGSRLSKRSQQNRGM